MSATIRNRRVSPSLIVASLALVVASSGSAVAAALITGAQIKNESVTGVDIKNKSLGLNELSNQTQKQVKNVTPLWALVAADGTLLRGKGVQSVSREDNGQYVVVFKRKTFDSSVAVDVVNEGAGNGQINWHHCANIPGGGPCFGFTGNKKAVFVNTEDSAGTNSDRVFSVLVNPGGIDFGPAPTPRPSQRIAKGADGIR